MRAIVAAVVLVSVMTGCNTKVGAGTGVAVGTLGVVAGAVVYASPPDSAAFFNTSQFGGGALMFVGGFVTIVSALSLAVVLRAPTTSKRARY